MGVGHAAVALASARVEPRINVGLLIFAAFLADFLLGVFAFLGLEQAHVPAGYAARHYLTFTFPYSHGLLFLLVWGILLGALLCWTDRQHRLRAFLVINALVLSHFVLDGLVHVPELPLAGPSSFKVGLGLWNHMPLELTLETIMAVVGLAIYWKMDGNSPIRRWGVAVFVLLLTALTWTQFWAVTPPTPSQLVPGWIVAPLVFSVIAYAFDRKRVSLQN